MLKLSYEASKKPFRHMVILIYADISKISTATFGFKTHSLHIKALNYQALVGRRIFNLSCGYLYCNDNLYAA